MKITSIMDEKHLYFERESKEHVTYGDFEHAINLFEKTGFGLSMEQFLSENFGFVKGKINQILKNRKKLFLNYDGDDEDDIIRFNLKNESINLLDFCLKNDCLADKNEKKNYLEDLIAIDDLVLKTLTFLLSNPVDKKDIYLFNYQTAIPIRYHVYNLIFYKLNLGDSNVSVLISEIDSDMLQYKSKKITDSFSEVDKKIEEKIESVSNLIEKSERVEIETVDNCIGNGTQEISVDELDAYFASDALSFKTDSKVQLSVKTDDSKVGSSVKSDEIHVDELNDYFSNPTTSIKSDVSSLLKETNVKIEASKSIMKKEEPIRRVTLKDLEDLEIGKSLTINEEDLRNLSQSTISSEKIPILKNSKKSTIGEKLNDLKPPEKKITMKDLKDLKVGQSIDVTEDDLHNLVYENTSEELKTPKPSPKRTFKKTKEVATFDLNAMKAKSLEIQQARAKEPKKIEKKQSTTLVGQKVDKLVSGGNKTVDSKSENLVEKKTISTSSKKSNIESIDKVDKNLLNLKLVGVEYKPDKNKSATISLAKMLIHSQHPKDLVSSWKANKNKDTLIELCKSSIDYIDGLKSVPTDNLMDYHSVSFDLKKRRLGKVLRENLEFFENASQEETSLNIERASQLIENMEVPEIKDEMLKVLADEFSGICKDIQLEGYTKIKNFAKAWFQPLIVQNINSHVSNELHLLMKHLDLDIQNRVKDFEISDLLRKSILYPNLAITVCMAINLSSFGSS
jgi:hypothetical protein